MAAGSSLRCAAFLLVCLVLLMHVSEGKKGGSSGGRGSSSARSSSSKSSGSRSYSSSSKSYSSSEWYSSSSHGRRSTWTSAASPMTRLRSGGGFTSSKSYAWTSSNPRPSVTRDSVSRGFFYSYSPSFNYGCGFAGCGHNFPVYHYYPRSHYHSHQAAATTAPISVGPKSDQVISVLNITATIDDPDAVVNSTEVMEIVDPTRPLLILDIAFFWDTKYLPSKLEENCTSYLPANDNDTIEFCKVDELQRCQRNLQELKGFSDGSLFFPDGTSPTHLAWMCPRDTVCCEWECCQDTSGFSVIEWILIMLAVGVVLYYTIRCAMSCFKTGTEIKVERAIYKEEKRKLTLAVSKAPSFDLP